MLEEKIIGIIGLAKKVTVPLVFAAGLAYVSGCGGEKSLCCEQLDCGSSDQSCRDLANNGYCLTDPDGGSVECCECYTKPPPDPYECHNKYC